MTKALTTVPKNFGTGGAGLYPVGGGSGPPAGKIPTVEQLLNEVQAAITELQQLRGAKGADLGDADATITVAQGNWRVLPSVPLTAGRTFTLSGTGATAGDQIEITRLDVAAFTVTIKDGVGNTTLAVLPVSKVNFATLQFDGTNWKLRRVGTQ